MPVKSRRARRVVGLPTPTAWSLSGHSSMGRRDYDRHVIWRLDHPKAAELVLPHGQYPSPSWLTGKKSRSSEMSRNERSPGNRGQPQRRGRHRKKRPPGEGDPAGPRARSFQSPDDGVGQHSLRQWAPSNPARGDHHDQADGMPAQRCPTCSRLPRRRCRAGTSAAAIAHPQRGHDGGDNRKHCHGNERCSSLSRHGHERDTSRPPSKSVACTQGCHREGTGRKRETPAGPCINPSARSTSGLTRVSVLWSATPTSPEKS
jgi:hypothetical protein